MKRILYLISIMAFFVALTIGFGNGALFTSDMGIVGHLDKVGFSQVQASEDEEDAIDPVCGMDAKRDPEKSIQHEDFTYYFCSKGCMEKFQGDLKKYACPCSNMGKVGCNCYHCTGRGGVCDCLEEIKREEKRKKKKH